MARLTLLNLQVNVVYYTITLVVLPWAILKMEGALGVPSYPSESLRAITLMVAIIAVALQAWAIVTFHVRGRGTPSPAWPPRHLVQEGPYMWLRNPLNLGEILLLLAVAAWFGSPGLLAYGIVAALAFHAFIVFCEEPRHRALFGRAFDDYCARVSRWTPGHHRSPKTHSDDSTR